MPYCDVANLVAVTKTNMIDEMPCHYGTLRIAGVRIHHQVSHRPAQRSQQLQNLTVIIVESRIILNAPPSLQVLSGARENALAQSESTLESSRGGAGSISKYLEALARATGVSGRFAYSFWTELHFADVDAKENHNPNERQSPKGEPYTQWKTMETFTPYTPGFSCHPPYWTFCTLHQGQSIRCCEVEY